MYADVLVQYSVKTLDHTFTYIIPDYLKETLKIGMKVTVPFGNTKINGFVVDIKNETDNDNLKEIIEIKDPEIVLNDELLKLGVSIKELTACSLISAYQAMLPPSLKVKTIKTNYQKYDEYIILKDIEKTRSLLQNKRSIKRNELINRLLNNEKVNKKEYSSEIIKKLLEDNIIELTKENKYRINKENVIKENLKLTPDQENVIKEIDLNKNDTYLLYGVTGSGKTEIYMHLITDVIKNGKCAILLVPEISLTTQIIDRFYQRFGNLVAIFHSSLSEGEKYDEYHKILNGDVKIVVGTRSAIFVPFKNIGIIIMDEEQSTNYKQDSSPKYHAKDVALERCKYHSCPLLLGSATPSLESMARGLKGVYKLLKLEKRIGNAIMPEVKLIDMHDEYKKRNMIISDELNNLIIDRLNKHEQIIIFLNRRGYSTIMNCKNCGLTFKCPHCDITLIYHKSSNNLRCHYCGYTLMLPDLCPDCHEKGLSSYGLGTEKLEEEIKKKYPDARTVRMDADTTIRKGIQAEIIDSIEKQYVDIIIGTQMISKGFDFPNVTLVGIINADDALNIPDFRSGERTFELLTQTSGRAGRGNIPGMVIIQTFNPDNKTLNFCINNDYMSLYNYEMNIRKSLKYPPYFYITIIKMTSKDYNLASSEATKAFKYLNKNLKDTIILGPTTSSPFKLNNVYRFQIILKYKNYQNIKKTILDLDEVYKSNTKVNLEIDNNPCNL